MAIILFIDFLNVLCYHLLSITACTNFMKHIAGSHSPHKGHCAFARQHCATCVMTSSSPEHSDPHEAFSKGEKKKTICVNHRKFSESQPRLTPIVTALAFSCLPLRKVAGIDIH